MKGHLYSTIETLGYFYRCLTPIHPWILFLLYSDPNSHLLSTNIDLQLNKQTSSNSTFFPLLLCIMYSVLKLNQLYTRYIELSESFNELFGNMVNKLLICSLVSRLFSVKVGFIFKKNYFILELRHACCHKR
jgi:hypothetical protein